MHFKRTLILFFSICACSNALAQKKNYTRKVPVIKVPPEGFENALFKIGDSVFVMMGTCKNNWYGLYTRTTVLPEVKTTAPQKAFLTVHGNILYNFSYRSYIDTPFAQDNLQQHLVQTTLRFLIKDKYPLQMTITNRSSNSPYFKNLTDVSFNFNRSSLLEHIKTDLRQKAVALVSNNPVARAEEMLNVKMQQAKELQLWLSSPARVQEFVEEKEMKLMQAALLAAPDTLKKINLPEMNNMSVSEKENIAANYMLPSLAEFKSKRGYNQLLNKLQQKLEAAIAQNGDNIKKKLVAKKTPGLNDSSLLEKYNKKKQELDELLTTIKKEEAGIKNSKKKIQDSVNKIRQQIAALQNPEALFAFMKQNGIAKSTLSKAQRVLLTINNFGIGRSWIDYSELTVKNISIAGINIEASPAPFYLAFAAGKVNYRFRDFILKNNRLLPDQHVAIARAGLGSKAKNNFIVSYYNGRKSLLNTSSSATPALLHRVMGLSVETKFAVNANNYLIAEFAKSSFGNTSASQQSANLIHSTVDLKTRTNEAYSIKLFSQQIPTNSRLTAFYRKTGENFQSFNLFPVNVNQEAWAVRLNQAFWKKRFVLDAAIRKNDFENPVALPSFTSTTIFKSVQASLRVPKYPFVSVGYYPTSQLSIINNNLLTESQYNTLNAIVNYSYQLAKTSMNTNAVYTKFYNSSSDTGFIYYNAVSAMLNHSFFLGRFTLQSGAAVISQKDLHMVTFEQMLGWQFKSNFSLNGSFKWNRLNKSSNLFGGMASINMSIKKLGVFQFNYEKTYLPGSSRQLLPVDIGRVSFYREF